MKAWIPGIVIFGVLWPFAASAQQEEPSLGDLARNLRKNHAAARQEGQVIDNENIENALDELHSRRPVTQDRFILSIDPVGKSIKASAADVTCSLSFNARSASALLVKPVLLENLPLPELLKIDGPGSIEDETLQLEVFNGTEWDLREITVGLTLERKPGETAGLGAAARVIPAAQNTLAPMIEKRSDVTLLYHLKATAKPFSKTTFKESIGITPGPDEDWRWSIVEAKGIRPQETQTGLQTGPTLMTPAKEINVPDGILAEPATKGEVGDDSSRAGDQSSHGGDASPVTPARSAPPQD